MAVDSQAKRMAVAHLKRYPAKGVFPGALDVLERAAAAWNYVTVAVPPPEFTTVQQAIGIGQKKSFASDLILGGGGGW